MTPDPKAAEIRARLERRFDGSGRGDEFDKHAPADLAWLLAEHAALTNQISAQSALREMLALFIDPADVTDLPDDTKIALTFGGPTLAQLRRWRDACR